MLDPYAYSPAPFTLLTSVFPMEQTYVKGTSHLRTKMARCLLFHAKRPHGSLIAVTTKRHVKRERLLGYPPISLTVSLGCRE